MQLISRAPVLSATFSLVSCWIISLLRLLENLLNAPALRLGERTRLRDANAVADAARVRFVVRLVLRESALRLAVQRVAVRVAHRDDDRLVHLVADDGADARLPCRALHQASSAVVVAPSSTASSRSRWTVRMRATSLRMTLMRIGL